jgi:G patch domain-containing protein 1
VQKSNGPRDLANIGLGEDETQGQDTLTYERPSMDIFKAIFASDDEDSDDEQEKEPEPDEQPDLPPSSTNRSSLVGLVTDDIPVDLSTFKPTFIPREGKSKKSKDERSKEKKEKKKEKKEKKGVLVSFAMDEDGTEAAQPKQSKDRPKKKRKDKKEGNDDDDVGMWADKPPLEVPNVISTVHDTTDTLPAPKTRKRAIDFM